MSVLSNLPPLWRQVEARDLLMFVTSGSRGWARYYCDHGAPFIRIGDLQRGTLRIDWENSQRVCPPNGGEGSRTRVQPGDVLVSITADLGVIGVVPAGVPESFINQHVALARPTSDVASRFFGWFLDAEIGGQLQFRELRRGATKAGLGLDDIRSIWVPVPPLLEQHRIVTAIETHFSRLDAAVASLTRARANVKRARASVLKAAVEGRLVPTEAALARAEGRGYENASVLLERILEERKAAWTASGTKGKYKEAVAPEVEGLGELAEGWCWASVDQIAAQPLSNGKSVPTLESGFPVLRLTSMNNGRINLRESKGGAWSRAEAAPWLVEGGDFLITRGNGSIRRVGCAAIAGDVYKEVAFPDTMIRLRPAIGMAEPRYLLAAWSSPVLRQQIEASARTTAGIYKVNQRSIANYVIPLPPLPEQHRIVAEVDRRLSVLDAIETVLATNLARCARLRQSILKRAFEGRLVPSQATPAVSPTHLRPQESDAL